MSFQNAACKMCLNTILDTKGPLEEDQIIPLHSNLSTMTELLLLKKTLPRQSPSGNTGGRYGKDKWYTVSDEPLKKRKKKK